MNRPTGPGTPAPPAGRPPEAAEPYDADIMVRASETFEGGAPCGSDRARTPAIVDAIRGAKDTDEACKALRGILERKKTCETHIRASHTASSPSR